jgi:hypothetical protein
MTEEQKAAAVRLKEALDGCQAVGLTTGILLGHLYIWPSKQDGLLYDTRCSSAMIEALGGERVSTDNIPWRLRHT